jgi:hypothetical protein
MLYVRPSGLKPASRPPVHHRRHQRRSLYRQNLPQVIELGPPNATIHKIDEYVNVADIEPLKTSTGACWKTCMPG